MSNRTNLFIGILGSAVTPPAPPADMYIVYAMFTAASGGSVKYAKITPATPNSKVQLTAPNDGIITSASANAFSADGTLHAITRDTSVGSNKIRLYSRSDTAIANLTAIPSIPNNSRDCAFSPSGNHFAVVNNASPFVRMWSISGTTFTLLADPSTTPGAAGYLAYSPNGQYAPPIRQIGYCYMRYLEIRTPPNPPPLRCLRPHRASLAGRLIVSLLPSIQLSLVVLGYICTQW
jgi:WD40 repeat protein